MRHPIWEAGFGYMWVGAIGDFPSYWDGHFRCTAAFVQHLYKHARDEPRLCVACVAWHGNLCARSELFVSLVTSSVKSMYVLERVDFSLLLASLFLLLFFLKKIIIIIIRGCEVMGFLGKGKKKVAGKMRDKER